MRRSRSAVPSFSLLAILTVCLCSLSGCAGQLAPVPIVPIAIMTGILGELARRQNKDLQFTNGTHVNTDGTKLPDKTADEQEDDRHKGFFITRRIEVHGAAGMSQADMVIQIGHEFDEVDAVAKALVGTPTAPGPLMTSQPDGASTAPVTEAFSCDNNKHIDLIAVASQRTGGPLNKLRHGIFQRLRVRAAMAIIWRAAGIHPELWDDTKPVNDQLRKEALEELLDRRLRLAERMEMQANAGVSADGVFPRVRRIGAYAAKNWVDDFRVRNFQYPAFDVTRNADLVEVDAQDQPVDTVWVPTEGEINFDNWVVPTSDIPNRRVKSRLGREHNPDEETDSTWDVFDEEYAYRRTFLGSTAIPTPETLPAAVSRLMQAKLNVWERTWWFCDHTISILHLDALRFGLLRRGAVQPTPIDGDTTLQTISTQQPIDMPGRFASVPRGTLSDPKTWQTWVPTPEPPPAPQIPAPIFNQEAAGTWFQNLYTELRSLQVGDHIVFNNHAVYTAISASVLRNENAVVTGIDSDTDGTLRLKNVRLAGLGMPSAPLAKYANDMARAANAALASLHTHLVDLTPAEQAAGCFVTPRKMVVFRWIPFTGIDPRKTPWFLFLPFSAGKAPYSVVWDSVEQMQQSVAHSFIDTAGDTSTDKGHNPKPPVLNAPFRGGTLTFNPRQPGVLFPLFLPRVGGKVIEWQDYMNARKDDDSIQVSELVPVVLSTANYDRSAPTGTTSDIPGVFITEPTALPGRGPLFFPIAIVRPRVRRAYAAP